MSKDMQPEKTEQAMKSLLSSFSNVFNSQLFKFDKDATGTDSVTHIN